MQIIEKSAPAHLFVEYVWCGKEQWEQIEPVYASWISSFSQDYSNHDRISLQLSKLIIEYSKKS
jgi:hypothetical protein